MVNEQEPAFDPKSFLAKVGEGRSIGQYRKDQVVFSQGDAADAVFYIQKGKVKLTVVSEQGKEAVVAMLGRDEFCGEGCLAGQPRRMATATAMTTVRSCGWRSGPLSASSMMSHSFPRCSLRTS